MMEIMMMMMMMMMMMLPDEAPSTRDTMLSYLPMCYTLERCCQLVTVLGGGETSRRFVDSSVASVVVQAGSGSTAARCAPSAATCATCGPASCPPCPGSSTGCTPRPRARPPGGC